MDSGVARGIKRPSSARGACARVVHRLRLPAVLCLPVRRPARVLAGGRMPACLGRLLRRPALPPRRLAKLCAWAEKPPLPPPLLAGPLFGRCLEEEVRLERPASRQPSQAEDQKVGLPPAPFSLSPASRRQPPVAQSRIDAPQPWERIATPRPAPVAASAAETVESLPKGASLEMLASHLGGFEALQRLSQAPGVERRRTARLPLSPAASPTTPPASLFPYSPAEWVSRLSRRLIHRLEQFSPPAAAGASSNSGAPEALAPAGLSRSLVTIASGIQAPVELLLRLAGERSVVGETPAPAARPATGAASELLRAPAQRQPVSQPAWETPFSDQPRLGAPAPAAFLPPGAQQGFYPQAGSLPLPGAGQPNFRPPLAAPLASETPPTLLSPQEVYDAPTPYAAAAQRALALRDQAELAEEDLDLLAEKIKRILDDEARRFGIPV